MTNKISNKGLKHIKNALENVQQGLIRGVDLKVILDRIQSKLDTIDKEIKLRIDEFMNRGDDFEELDDKN